MSFLVASTVNTHSPLTSNHWKIYRHIDNPVNFYNRGLSQPNIRSLFFLISRDDGLTFTDRLFRSAEDIRDWIAAG